jgi:hypothetical protein
MKRCQVVAIALEMRYEAGATQRNSYGAVYNMTIARDQRVQTIEDGIVIRIQRVPSASPRLRSAFEELVKRAAQRGTFAHRRSLEAAAPGYDRWRYS